MNHDAPGPDVGPTPPPQSKPPLSPRRRRLRWTVAILLAVFAVAVVAGVISYFRTRPQLYSPEEKNPEITSSLSRDLPPEAPQPRFTDVTRAAGLAAFRTFAGDRTSQLPEDMGSGAAWGDFDNDGDDDLFLVSAGGPLNAPTEKLLPCELYENLGNGAFRKVESFPDVRIHGMGAAWGDYDGDGFLDLVVSGYNALRLFHNEQGTGRFVRDSRFPDLKGFWAGVAWGDYNNDRNLDLYVCGYVQYVENDADRTRGSDQLGTFVPYTLNPASYEPALNLLFRNNGDGTFTEVAKELGVTNPSGRSLGALWHDFDDDGWLDLYVANDISDNALYHNTGGKFEDISYSAWVADYRSAMGLAAGDYNRDGDDDLFISHWIAQQDALYDNLWADYNVQRAMPADGSRRLETNRATAAASLPSGQLPPASPPSTNSLGTNSYPLRFMDVADRKGLGQIALPFIGWGTEFVDFDGDGWLDLVVANGSTLEFDGPMPRRLKPQEPFLFWNRRGEYFHNLAPLNKALSEQHVGRGLAVSDFDNDGAMDILIVHLGEGVQLLRNEMQTGHWLKTRLHSRLRNGAWLGFGDGAKVIAHVQGVPLRRTVSSASYLSQSSRVLHFGLGEAKIVDRLEVRWLGGQTNFFTNLAADATWEIREGEPVPKRIEPRLARAGGANEKARALAGAVNPRPPGIAPSPPDKTRQIEFWNKQRAAMNALKLEKDVPKAIRLFRDALELNSSHEDSLYYLGQCLAAQGDVPGALAQWEELMRINPHSHRAYQQWGTFRAISSNSDADLKAAEQCLEKAHAINPEETGALLILGEVALLRGDLHKADQRLTAACRTNPRAAGGFFLRGYLAWKRGDETAAKSFLTDARQALGKDWQPKGSTAEGDVKRKQHVDGTPLARFWETWNGTADSAGAFIPLEAFLRSKR